MNLNNPLGPNLVDNSEEYMKFYCIHLYGFSGKNTVKDGQHAF